MKIVALVRTYNEEQNIGRFCSSYSWADKILVADGGSTDRTVKIAKTFPNVEVRDFLEVVHGANGTFRNPEGKHINFLISWANEIGCDWMTFEDCDCFLTKPLQEKGKQVFIEAEELGHTCIKLMRVYLYDVDKWFSNNTSNLNWAWKPELGIIVSEADPWGIVTSNVPEVGYILYPPYGALHDFARTPEIGQAKIDHYNATERMGTIPKLVEVFGTLSPRESWMYD